MTRTTTALYPGAVHNTVQPKVLPRVIGRARTARTCVGNVPAGTTGDVCATQSVHDGVTTMAKRNTVTKEAAQAAANATTSTKESMGKTMAEQASAVLGVTHTAKDLREIRDAAAWTYLRYAMARYAAIEFGLTFEIIPSGQRVRDGFTIKVPMQTVDLSDVELTDEQVSKVQTLRANGIDDATLAVVERGFKQGNAVVANALLGKEHAEAVSKARDFELACTKAFGALFAGSKAILAAGDIANAANDATNKLGLRGIGLATYLSEITGDVATGVRTLGRDDEHAAFARAFYAVLEAADEAARNAKRERVTGEEAAQ